MTRRSATVVARCAAVLALGALIAGCTNLRHPVPRGAVAPPLVGTVAAPGHVGLSLTPARVVAPIGTEVVLIASVHNARGAPLVGQPIEWMLAQDGVGQFLSAARGRSLAGFAGSNEVPRKIDNTYATGRTSRRTLTWRRAAADPRDDIVVREGEAWISITSPTTGTSSVTCSGPAIPGWQHRHQTAQIYWVDAQFSFPPPAVSAAGGRQTITTTVTRQSDQAPLAGWLVRYEISGGPAAGFGADGAQVIEVVTNPQGQATAEVTQMAPAAGTSEVRIQIIRPADARDAVSRPFVAATGTTHVTWSASDVSLTTTGPAVSRVGAEATYRLTVTNRGDLRATGVIVTGEVPPGMTYVASQPAAEAAGGQLKWTLGDLEAGESRTIAVNVRTTETGTFNFCGEVTTAQSAPSRSCAATTVSDQSRAAIEIDVRGPAQATVGDRVTFTIVVTNRGTSPATRLRISDEFPAELKHDTAVSPIEDRQLVDLAPGQQTQIDVTFTVVAAGEHCHTAKVTGRGGLLATKRVCIRATAAVAPAPAVTPARAPAVSLRITPPPASRVGQKVVFAIDVTNTGNVALSNVVIKTKSDQALKAKQATRGHDGKDEPGWIIESLAVGATKPVQVEYECLQAAAEACMQVEVTTAQLPARRDRRCIRIDAARAAQKPAMDELSLKIAERTSPVKVGGKTIYEVLVQNISGRTLHDVTLTATVPPEMTLDVETNATLRGNVATFATRAELGPGEQFSYQVHVTARQPGKAHFVARLSARELSDPVEASKETLVFAERQ
ncbi:MAG: DUF11 domain-containing protein [Planctomycetes bacterium]|nr:DUF11 domain-containing protein [Planctomycetota bacterium]